MINKVFLLGRVGNDCEFKTLDSGTLVCNFSVVTNSYYKDKSGEYKQKSQWHKIECYNKVAESCKLKYKKGILVNIVASIEYVSWENNSGVKVYKTLLKAESVYFIDDQKGG